MLKAPVSGDVFERSYLTPSFVVDLILDKVLYSIPIYRQHQRLKLEGFHVSRRFLTNSFNKVCRIWKPIVQVQMLSILMSRVLAIDETPMKVGVDKTKHKMKKGYVWPVYGEAREIVYHYNASRGAKVLKELLGDFERTILSDGYKVVDEYFSWLMSFQGRSVLATNKDLRDAVRYSLEREDSMRVFLKDPEVQLDTNHLEREIRQIAIGRKNFMFCWTEVEAENLCIAQSLVRTCLLHGINPREYLIDVLQRLVLEEREDGDVLDLIPRVWKEEHGNDLLSCASQRLLLERTS